MRISGITFLFLLAATTSLSALTSTSTSLSSSLNPSTYGQAVTFTAKVTSSQGAPPDGEIVNFLQGSKTIGTGTLSSGIAKFTISTLTTGAADNIKAQYKGDSTFASSTSAAVAQVVNKASTNTSLNSSRNPSNFGQSVTLTATINAQFGGTITGNVAFYSGGKKLGSVSVSSGAAAYKTTTLALGSDPLSAVYNGSSSFLTSNSNTVNQSVEEGNFINSTMNYGGMTRYYQTYVPAVLPQNPALVVMLHGTNYDVPPNNPSTVNWGWQSVADANAFVVVQPASTYNTKTGQWNWNAYFMDASFQGPVDDSGFLRQLITNLSSQYNIDPKMVYVTGFSSGAQMTERVGVELSDIVAAIAPASGQLVGQEVPPPTLPGNAAAPISVQEWHGTVDNELQPCDYGTTVYSAVTYTLDTVDDTFNYWVQQNNCSNLQTTQTLCLNGQPRSGLSGNIATGCSQNVEVQFIWEPNVGHNWVAGNNTARWQFLSSHPKP